MRNDHLQQSRISVRGLAQHPVSDGMSPPTSGSQPVFQTSSQHARNDRWHHELPSLRWRHRLASGCVGAYHTYIRFRDCVPGCRLGQPCRCGSVGLLATVYPISSFDGVLHMSRSESLACAAEPVLIYHTADETVRKETGIPQAMVFGLAVNAVQMITFCICLTFSIGDEARVAGRFCVSMPRDPRLSTLTGLFQYRIEDCRHSLDNDTRSPADDGNFNIVASVTRLIDCFAKHGGLPFPEYCEPPPPTKVPRADRVTGPSKAQRSSPSPHPRWRHLLPAVAVQHWLHNSL